MSDRNLPWTPHRGLQNRRDAELRLPPLESGYRDPAGRQTDAPALRARRDHNTNAYGRVLNETWWNNVGKASLHAYCPEAAQWLN